MSLNLHSIVRHAINTNYQDDSFTYYRSLGQENVNGLIKALYAPAETITGNFQSEGDSTLDHANLAGQNSTIRKLYIHASNDRESRPWSLYRPLARSGDYIVDKFGGYWLITAVLEDFSDAGWVCVRCTFQTDTPQLTIKENDDEEDTENENGTGTDNQGGEFNP